MPKDIWDIQSGYSNRPTDVVECESLAIPCLPVWLSQHATHRLELHALGVTILTLSTFL
jgi:hypothetical protein